MPNRIDKLTPEQEAAMKPYAEKWIEIGLRTGETDWETFDKYMPICYEKAGLKYPERVVRVQSPLVGGLAASVAEAALQKFRKHDAVRGAVGGAVGVAVRGAVGDAVGGAVGNAVRGAVGDAVRDAVDNAVRGAVDNAVGNAVGDAVRGAVGSAVDNAVGVAVDNAVRNAVGGAIRGAVDNAVRDAVGGAVGDAVDNAVRGAVDNAVGDAVRDAVGNAVDNAVGVAVATAISIAKKAGVALSWHYWLGGQFWVGGYWYWSVAFVNFFFDVCKLKLTKDLMERAEALKKVSESVNYIWPNSDFVMVCARPKAIHRDNQGRLHSETTKAIEYPDGWGLYSLWGVRLSYELWQKIISKHMTFKEIMAIENIDQRMVALKMNPEGMLDKKDLIHKSDRGNELYLVTKIFSQNAYFLKYKDPSTDRIYISGVDPEYAKKNPNADNCMAWKFNLTPEVYNALRIET